MKKKYSAPQINNVELSIEEMVLGCCKMSSSMNTMSCTNGGCVGATFTTASGNILS